VSLIVERSIEFIAVVDIIVVLKAVILKTYTHD